MNVDLDVSIEKMTTGLRIVSRRTQGRTVKGSVERDTKKTKRENGEASKKKISRRGTNGSREPCLCSGPVVTSMLPFER